MTEQSTEIARIGDCAICARKGVRVHHIRRLGDLEAGRLACVDEQACLVAFTLSTRPGREPS